VRKYFKELWKPNPMRSREQDTKNNETEEERSDIGWKNNETEEEKRLVRTKRPAAPELQLQKRSHIRQIVFIRRPGLHEAPRL
jgi:hypothetical protein